MPDGDKFETSNAPRRPEEDREIMLAILDQGRLSFELLRRLIDLLTPKTGGREGPTLEQLLSQMISQQHALAIQVEEVRALLGQVPQAVADEIEERDELARLPRA